MLQFFLNTFPRIAKRAPILSQAKSPKGRIAATLLVFNYLQAGVSFAVSMWLANKLGEDAYGVIGYGFTLAAICSTLVDFGGERTLVRDLTHSEDAQATMTASISLRLLVAIVVCVGVVIWISFSTLAQNHPGPLFLCALSGMLFGLSPKGWYDYQYLMGKQAAIMFAEKVLYSILTVSLVLLFPGPIGILIVAACLFGSRLASFTVQWWQALRTLSFNTQSLSKDLVWLVSQNTYIAAAMLGNLMAPHINGLVLGHQKGEAAMAHYFLAFQVVAVVNILQQVAARMLVPRIADVTRPETPVSLTRSRFIRFCLYSLTITLVIVIPLILLAGWLISTFLPAGFQASVNPLRLLLLSCIAHSIGLIVNHFLVCLRKNAHYFVTSISKGGIAILLGWILIPQYGANGVAITFLVCAILTMAVQFGLAWNAISKREPRLT